jgi:hypothetical protein
MRSSTLLRSVSGLSVHDLGSTLHQFPRPFDPTTKNTFRQYGFRAIDYCSPALLGTAAALRNTLEPNQFVR